MQISNPPPADAETRTVSAFRPFARVAEGILVAISPVRGACVSSGFGERSGRFHKGIDLQVKPADMVHAAAKGRVREAGFRPDYGNQVVLEHGPGVFTRYAHLKGLEPGVVEGAELPFGAPLGLMGASSAYDIPLHLHFELLTGDYETGKKSFGLTPQNIFNLPRAE
jgi:murein DD-endopeptidase MepM/ murein hydrolase activator NlpD